MEYVVPLVILLVVVLAVVVVSRVIGRRNQSGPAAEQGSRGRARRTKEVTREDAEAASAILPPDVHRKIYSLIAQNKPVDAIREYRRATSAGLADSAAAIAALAQFPQATPTPKAAEPRVTSFDDTPLTVADIMKSAPESAPEAASAGEVPAVPSAPQPAEVSAPVSSDYRYRAIVSRGNEVREVASTRLNEEIYSAIRDLALAGNYDGAANLLRDHAEIGPAEAREFVEMIQAQE